MRRLAGAMELLDGPLDNPDLLRGNLHDLARINRWLGGTAASRRALAALLGGRTVPHTMLDVGTGGADIPLALLDHATRHGRRLTVTGLDSRGEVLAAARGLDPRVGTHDDLDLVVHDGRSLPWPDRSFDVVHASLLVHHLEPPDVLAFLREAARVARLGVIVNDLVRARRHWLGARVLLGVTTRNRYTRHDGPLSVKRAYTRMELRALLAGAALRPIAEVSAFAGHRVAIAAVPMRALEQHRSDVAEPLLTGGGE
ncbi:MAG TPA: methyltransferase domain-containing protein [Candidatus Limnocylindrales bacterium]|nr:methyltransferase domain-containing protein [Candidatus Limnocylindrales bacterium]